MPYDVKRFIFSVSLCAILAVNPVLATAPGETESVGAAHTVYDGTNLNKATNGIAGVGYVNRMVDAAGNAATAAEAHAAAAGAHALSAAQSAAEAHEVLADKVSIDQGADNKNKVMVTDDAGSVYAGYVTDDMIATAEDEVGKPLLSWSGKARWAQVGSAGLVDGAVTTNKIANGAVTNSKINDGAISLEKMNYVNAYASGVVSDGIPLVTNSANGLVLSQVSSVGIADGAVTAEKIAPDPSGISGVLLTQPAGVSWGKISDKLIADGAVTADKIANRAVTSDKLDFRRSSVEAGMPLVVEWKNNTTGVTYGAGTILPSGIVSADENGMALVSQKHVDSSGRASYVTEWGQVSSVGIANGAVTIDKTAGVVGMVPVGAADATTYGQFWIE